MSGILWVALAVAIAIVPMSSCCAAIYTYTVFNPQPGLPVTLSAVLGVNASGDMVGAYMLGGKSYGFYRDHATGTLHYLGLGAAHSINDYGQVAGRDDSSGARAYVWSLSSGFSYLGSGAGFGINNAGQVVGVRYEGGSSSATLWDPNGGITDLGAYFGGTRSFATSINRYGEVCGCGNASGSLRAYIWSSASGAVCLDASGSSISDAQDINDSGCVSGTMKMETTGSPNHPAVWQRNGGLKLLDTSASLATFGGVRNSGINNLGQVVYGPWLWEADGARTTLPGDCLARDISDSGWIVGQIGQSAAFWTLVPEPVSITALASQLVALSLVIRRRRRASDRPSDPCDG